jgi:phospholipid transport system substrate-binding protein
VAWATAEASGPTLVVQKLNDGMLGVLKQAEELGYQGRYERLSSILDDAFDLEYMARAAVGRHWSQLSAAEQENWVETFKRLTSATYAGRFEKYTGQQFAVLAEEPAANETVLVRTRVIDPGNENVDLDYRLRSTPAGWQVIDVYFKGTVSEVALRRSEYAAVLKREGFAALQASVNRKIGELASGGGNP